MHGTPQIRASRTETATAARLGHREAARAKGLCDWTPPPLLASDPRDRGTVVILRNDAPR